MSTCRDLKHWREEVGRSLLNLDFRAEIDQPFHYKMDSVLVSNGVRVVRSSHSPGYTFRDRDLLRDGNNCLALVYPVRGTLTFSQSGGGTIRRNGEAKLLVCDQPGHVGAKTAWDCVSIVFQPEDLPSQLDIGRLARSPWRATGPALRLLRSYVESLNSLLIRPDSDLAGITRQHILDLVRQAALEQETSPAADPLTWSTIGSARLQVACEDIARNLHDPGLAEGMIAAQQGISTRQLQRVFEAAGLTFTGQVQEMRLNTALKMLSHPVESRRTIAEIALASGFSDISHFNRLFRRRFGATPGEMRRNKN
ncbi:MAG: AraC family transcriptional regulator [Hyphomicrobiaceae bacterium]